jgi:hypothetical protein
MPDSWEQGPDDEEHRDQPDCREAGRQQAQA